MDAEAVRPCVLQRGPGVNPLQWFSSACAHVDWMHLIGNMLFLWTFSLVVEGKPEWRRFLPVYLFLTAGCGLVGDEVTQHDTKAWRVQELAAEAGKQLEAGDAELLAELLRDKAKAGSLGGFGGDHGAHGNQSGRVAEE